MGKARSMQHMDLVRTETIFWGHIYVHTAIHYMYQGFPQDTKKVYGRSTTTQSICTCTRAIEATLQNPDVCTRTCTCIHMYIHAG